VSAKRSFEGTLRPDGTGLNWTVITVPFDPAKAWPKRQRLRVRGTINGFAFRTSLFRARDTSYILLVNRKMQKQAGVRQGTWRRLCSSRILRNAHNPHRANWRSCCGRTAP
jgi:hypothetical protein